MLNEDNNKLNQTVDEINRVVAKLKGAFQLLLDIATSEKDKYLAVSARMGGNKSYISSVPLRWFADIHFASDFDIFEEYRDDHSKSVAINQETLDTINQRKPDWSRQLVMTAYLALRDHHKFPPVLLVAYQDWVLDKDHDNWGMDHRALQDSITCEPLDSNNWVVNINHKDTKFYALDGQHRLMAVRGLRDLIQGTLFRKDKDGKSGKVGITFEDILRHHTQGDGHEAEMKQKLLSMMDEEQIGVEIIPVVQSGETREEAFRRLRQIFVDVNQNAKRFEKGELALLDETNGFNIVARQVMVTHDLFRKENGLRVDVKSSQLSKTSEHYTTLQTIANIAKRYLRQVGYEPWEREICGIKGAGLLRPSPTELEDGTRKLSSYFGAIMTLPSHRHMIHGVEAHKLRTSADEGGWDHVLFRPVAQEALAEAIGKLETDNDISPEQACTTLAKKDDRTLPDLKLTNPASPFFGVLCDPISKTMRRHSAFRDLATQMFCHLLGGGTSDDVRQGFAKSVFDSRRITPEEGEKAEAIGFDGNNVRFEKFELPHPW